ncbi:MAG: hypothetical protein P8Y23_07905, partial [Candidatus Lokiarchaeota archaeon]
MTLMIHFLFGNIGLIGIGGIFSFIIIYKRNPHIFKILSLWFLFLIGISFSFILFEWFRNPSYSPLQLPDYGYQRMAYWFNRTWFYSVIPLSCFA